MLEVRARLVIASLIMSILATGLFLVACSGSNSQASTIMDVPWVEASDHGPGGDVNYYFGATATVAEQDSSATMYKYVDCQSQTKLCNTCYPAGRQAMGLMACAVFFAFVTIITSAKRINAENPSARGVGIIASGLAIFFSVVAVGLFNSCYAEIYLSMNQGYYSIGVVFILFGMLLLAVALVLLTLLPMALDMLKPKRRAAVASGDHNKTRPIPSAQHTNKQATPSKRELVLL